MFSIEWNIDLRRKNMYDINELFPVVAMLSRQFTGIESSSVSYEKASQLMEAVLYCIQEAESYKGTSLISPQSSAMQVYKTGAQLVRRKTEELLVFYENHKKQFCTYGNVYLADLLYKEIPAFFQYYDENFAPQNTILTLDYPIFMDLSEYQGIDCIDLYVRSIADEQRFLAKFGEDYVRKVLQSYSANYQDLPENIAGIVFGNVIGHLIVGKKLTDRLLEGDLRKICEQGCQEGFIEKVTDLVETFLQQHFTKELGTIQYMKRGLTDICVRISAVAISGNINKIVVY